MSADSPIVDEVRQRAGELSAQYGHDLRKYVEHLREIEARHRARVVDQVTVIRAAPAPPESPREPRSRKSG